MLRRFWKEQSEIVGGLAANKSIKMVAPTLNAKGLTTDMLLESSMSLRRSLRWEKTSKNHNLVGESISISLMLLTVWRDFLYVLVGYDYFLGLGREVGGDPGEVAGVAEDLPE